MHPTPPKAVLVDRRNIDSLLPVLHQLMQNASLVGFDIESHDADRHQGLNDFMGVKDPNLPMNKEKFKLVFDTNRTVVTGFSIYIEGTDYAFYFNLAHADVENRITFDEIRPLLESKPEKAWWVAHNAPFELVNMLKTLGFSFKEDILCTMQMAVSAFGPDQYDEGAFHAKSNGCFAPLFGSINRLFSTDVNWNNLTTDQSEVLNKVVGKSADSEFSYNGFVRSISYGYGLKGLVEKAFGYKMTSFKETLRGRAHMGQITGEEVVAYGCDDAFWAVKLFEWLRDYMLQTNPAVLHTFFRQENPMIHVYAENNATGIRVNYKAIEDARGTERKAYADTLRQLKAALRFQMGDVAQWPTVGPNPDYLEKEAKWYGNNWEKYQAKIIEFAFAPDSEDDYVQCLQVNGAISDSWYKQVNPKAKKAPPKISITHYMPIRVILHDLCQIKPRVSKDGVVQCDGDVRAVISDRLKPGQENIKVIIQAINDLTSVEQRMKLYINSYLQLTDPETHRMYPVLSSKLATRRLASVNPNVMQLAKQGSGAYIRGFYLPDNDDHVYVSIDWSQIELVLIGEMSQDPEFLRCYQQLPYEDLHTIAMASAFDVADEVMKKIKSLPDDVTEYEGIKFINDKGEQLTPKGFFKYARTAIGKVSNFNYWYSGALSSVGQNLGWSSEKMWEATEKYRTRFHVAEAWRVGVQHEVAMNGFVTLPDHHRRVRFEATEQWAISFFNKWRDQSPALETFARICINRIQKRAKNQTVNAIIQGTSATLAKRSILEYRHRCNADLARLKPLTRFVHPIHDELLYSVHRDAVIDFIPAIKEIMCNHPDIVKSVPLDATASLGMTFQPFNTKTAPLGQFELDEAHEVDWIPAELHGKKLDAIMMQNVMDYMFNTRKELLGF